MTSLDCGSITFIILHFIPFASIRPVSVPWKEYTNPIAGTKVIKTGQICPAKIENWIIMHEVFFYYCELVVGAVVHNPNHSRADIQGISISNNINKTKTKTIHHQSQ